MLTGTAKHPPAFSGEQTLEKECLMNEQSAAEKDTENRPVDDFALDQIFRKARTINHFDDRPVPETILQAIYDLMKMGPTSANCCPARLIFVTSEEGRERLAPHLSDGNRDKSMSAPCTVIIGHDMEFHEKLPELFPHTDAKSWFAGNDDLIAETAFRNGSLQGAYFMLAARALGLDCGPMSGFDKDGIRQAFFPDSPVIPNFLCNIGYGTSQNLFPRSPRLDFGQVCEIV